MAQPITWNPIIVIAGKHKGKISKIQKKEGDYVFLEWLNIYKKAQKWKGYVDVHLPVHVSNVMYYADDAKKASKLSTTRVSGKKTSIVKKTGKTA